MLEAQIATTTSPWWGVPLVAGVFTVLGVGIAQVMAWASDRRKAEREDRQRWLADRRQIYATFLTTAATIRLRFHDAWPDGMERAARNDLTDGLDQRRQELVLIASEEVMLAAEHLFSEILAMANDLTRFPGNNTKRDSASNAVNDAVGAMATAARQELGVEPRDIEPARYAGPACPGGLSRWAVGP